MKENEIRRVVPMTSWIVIEEPVMIRHMPASEGGLTFDSISLRMDVDRQEASINAARMANSRLFDTVAVES